VGLDLNKEITSRRTTPEGTTHVILQFVALLDPYASGSYDINDVSLTTASSKLFFTSNLESDDDLEKWTIINDNFLLRNRESADPLSGENSLRIDIPKGNTLEWQTVSSVFPAQGNIDTEYRLTIAAQNTGSPHVKVFYYGIGNKILGESVIFRSPSQNYVENVIKTLRTPQGTEHIGLQFWAKPNPLHESTFVIDDISVSQKLPSSLLPSQSLFRSLNSTEQNVFEKDGLAKVTIDNRSNQPAAFLIETPLIPVGQRSQITP
jgi:hypothetical protein